MLAEEYILNEVLCGFSTGDKLKLIIQEEVSIYRQLLDKKGSSIPLIFYEDEEIILNHTPIKNLLQETYCFNFTKDKTIKVTKKTV